MRRLLFLIPLLPSVALGADYTINQDGINSKALGLTGAGVLIGQVELSGRAAKHGADPPAATNSQVVPAVIYGSSTTDHGTWVAGVMIAKTDVGLAIHEGVAPEAILHSNYWISGFSSDDAASIAMNQLANIDNMRAINLSWGHELSEIESPSGDNHMAQFVDWSAADDDVLYIVGGTEQGRPDFSTPQDNFNGMTIGASQSLNAEGMDPLYSQAWFGNTTIGDADGDERVSIDLLAPGWAIRVPGAGNTSLLLDGTSLAAPHVTGAVALLHQFADGRMNTENAHRHEVIKSILLNSADKVAGIHGSNRTVFTQSGLEFRGTSAYFDPFQSLDVEIGAGHLNVVNALRNYRAREQEPGTVQPMGWDYGTLGAPGSLEVYFLDNPLAAGTWVTITAAWDRIVEKIGVNDHFYQSTDTFFPGQLNDLDIFLVPTLDPENFVSASASAGDNVEHIFFQIEDAGSYAIIIQHSGGHGSDQDYALSWWAGDVTPADFDFDFNVDGEDLDEWEMSFGSDGGGDADNDGDSDGSDFLVWQRNLGMTAATTAAAPVPEPASIALALLSACGVSLAVRRRK